MPTDDGAAAAGRYGVGLALVLLSTAVFGSTPALVRFVRGEVAVVDLVVYRAALVALVFHLLARLARARAAPHLRAHRPGPARGLAVGAALWGPHVLVFYASFEYIDTSLSVAIGFVYPTMVLFLVAALAATWPGRSDLALSALALVGIAALLLPGSSAGVRPLGVVLALLAATTYAGYVLLARALLEDSGPFDVGAQVYLGAAVSAAAIGLGLQRLSLLTTPAELATVGAHAALMVLATTCYYGGLVRLGPTQTSLVDTAQPALALLVGSLLLGERMIAVQVVGVALVTLSVAVSSTLAHRRAVAAVAPAA